MKKSFFVSLFIIHLLMLTNACANKVDDQFCCGRAFYELNGKYGYIDTKGNSVIPAQWDYASSFYENGYAYVFNGTLTATGQPDTGLYGIIDTNGDYCLPMQSCKRVSVYDPRNTGIFSITYEIARFTWQYEYRAFDGRILGNKRWDNAISGFLPMPVAEGPKEDQKWGYVTEDGIMIPCQYDKAFPFVNGIALVKTTNIKGQVRYVYINISGEQIISGDWDYAYDFTEDGYARVFKGSLSEYGTPKNGKYAFINTHGELICDYSFDDAKNFSEGFALVASQTVKGSKKWGFINVNGQIVIPQQWDYAFSFKNGYARVFNGSVGDYGPESGLYGFIDCSGSIISDIQWSNANDYSDIGIAKVKDSNGLWGYLTADGSELIAPVWDEIGNFYDGIAYVKKNEKYGYINEKGEQIIDLIWDAAGNYSDGVAIVHDNTTWYIIDASGNIIF